VDYAFYRLLIEKIITLTVTTKWSIHSTLWYSPLYFPVIFRAWRQKNVITPVVFGRFTPNQYGYNTFKYGSTGYTCFGKRLLPTTLLILAPKLLHAGTSNPELTTDRWANRKILKYHRHVTDIIQEMKNGKWIIIRKGVISIWTRGKRSSVQFCH
jgi:hypothetical protein